MNQVKNNDLIGKIIKIAVPVVAIGLVLAILSGIGLFTHGSEKALKKYLQASVKGDGKAVFELSVNPYELERKLEDDDYGYDNKQDIIDEYVDDYEDIRDENEDDYGKNVRL